MSGSLQSHDYVPGRSGFKIDLKAGEFEINSARISVGSLPTDPQLIVITAGEWSDSELPSNAIERYKFIGEQLAAIPDEYRDSAEFSTEDVSFDRDGSDYRTTLTYERRETAEEVTARLSKPKGSTFKIDRGELTFSRDGVDFIKMVTPFVTEGGQAFINEATITDAAIDNRKIGVAIVDPDPGNYWAIKMATDAAGKFFAAGVGAGVDPQFLVSPDKFAVKESTEFERAKAKGVDAVLELLAGKIGKTELSEDLSAEVEKLAQKQGAENLAIAERIGALSTRLGELHTMVTQTKDTTAAQAKREVAEALLRDIEADKSGGTLGGCIRRFGGVARAFDGYTGSIPLKR